MHHRRLQVDRRERITRLPQCRQQLVLRRHHRGRERSLPGGDPKYRPDVRRQRARDDDPPDVEPWPRSDGDGDRDRRRGGRTIDRIDQRWIVERPRVDRDRDGAVVVAECACRFLEPYRVVARPLQKSEAANWRLVLQRDQRGTVLDRSVQVRVAGRPQRDGVRLRIGGARTRRPQTEDHRQKRECRDPAESFEAVHPGRYTVVRG